MADYRYVLADVFTDTPLEGNQLAVFTDARGMDEATMQAFARETKLSETVFVFPPEGEGHVRIRIFTPAMELPFAGHPILGTAFVLGGPLQVEVIRLETLKGIVPVRLEREGPRIVFGRMAQPLPEISPYEAADEILAAIGAERALLPVELYDNGMPHAYVTLGSREQVAGLRPDMARLAALPGGVCVSCIAGDGKRWKTRVFAPLSGVDEDPATGSAAGPLALHLVRHGRIGLGEEIEIEQGAEIGRPSRLYARIDGSGDEVDRIEVGGSAVTVARGEFRI